MVTTKSPDRNLCCRDVAIFDEVVVKYGNRRFNWDQNKAEAALWRKVKKTPDAKYFAPVLSSDRKGRWVIMARIYPLNREPTDKERAKILRLGKRYNLRDLSRRDDGTHNWFVTENGPVIIDYGV